MGKMIQVRNVPDELHAELTRRAKATRMTLTDYVERILAREVARPPAEEVFDRIEADEPVELDRPTAEYIREAREERDRELMRRLESGRAGS